MSQVEDDNKSTVTTPITKIKSIIPNSKSKNNLFMTIFNHSDSLVKSSSQYIIKQTPDDMYNEHYWSLMIPSAAYFHVYNSVLGDVFAMVFNNNFDEKKKNEEKSKNNTLSTFIISKHGCSVHPNIHISQDSKYYPAIENLNLDLKSSKVRKALAVALLKTFADLDDGITGVLYKQAHLSNKTFDWDETQAGLLASEMTLIDTKAPSEVGNYLYELGYLTQNLSTASYVVDVIYTDEQDNDTLAEQNNALAFLLGKQLEQLFDPLSEYSPEPTEKAYKPPLDDSTICIEEDNILIRSICSELITVQTNYTVLLVQFLQNFVVPLRIQVLEGKLPGFTTAKLNQIFPPTIDEVTRINCIFLDMLKLAQPYGSYEILKACGTTIPYFYKAQMRHEAAIKNFYNNYTNFVSQMNAIKRSDLITLDQRTVQTSVYSSLNLVKIQLIIQRLVKNKDWPDELKENVSLYLNSCDNTISSFANDKLTPYNGRIFTPTGKILAEIAKGWPSELQYGWLTRRVVAVFDAVDILVENVKNRSVIIVFSDHALFLTIDDDDYYAERWKDADSFKKSNSISEDFISNSIHKPSVSDILIHSLTNETPLTQLPRMSVKYWANINDLHALYFTSSINAYDSKEPASHIRFFNEKDPSFTGIYQLDKVSGKYVTEVLARSKILNKTQSFHLFCGSISNNDLNDSDHTVENNINHDDKTNTTADNLDLSSITKRVYYTAHESSTYDKEDTKSPFIVLFNRKYDSKILDEFNVYSFITLNFINENTVRIEGLSRCKIDGLEHEKLLYDVNVDVLSVSLSLILTELFSTHMSLYNPMMLDYLLANNGNVNSQAFTVLNIPTETMAKEKRQILDSFDKNKLEREIIRSASNNKLDKHKSLELLENDLKHSNSIRSPKKTKKDGQKKTVQFKAGQTEITSTVDYTDNIYKTPPASPKKSKNGKGNNNKKLFFKFFTKPKTSTANISDPVLEKPKRKSSILYRNLTTKKQELDYSSLRPARPKTERKKSPQSFTIFSHKSDDSLVREDKAVENEVKKSDIPVTLTSSNETVLEKGKLENNSSGDMVLQPVALDESEEPIELDKVSNEESNVPIEEGDKPVENQVDNTTMSTGIYVNSHFEFPMEPDNKEVNGQVIPNVAQINYEPAHNKGYKDSVDMMGKFKDEVKQPQHKKEKSSVDMMGRLNVNFDEDLFELSTDTKNIVNHLQPPQLSSVDVIKPTSIHSENSQPSSAVTGSTSTFTPKIGELTPATAVSNVDIQDSKDSDFVAKEYHENESTVTAPDTSKRRSLWRVMAEPVPVPIVNLQRSDSFYSRFKDMRNEQERVLKETGINYVPELDQLPTKDRQVLSEGLILSASVNSGMDDYMDSSMNNNWTVVDKFSRSSSKQFNLSSHQDNSMLQQFEPISPKKPTSISIVERKIVQVKPIPTPTRSKFLSQSSSVYLSQSEDELKKFAETRNSHNTQYNNPYFFKNEEDSGDKYDVFNKESNSESVYVPNVELYDDVDLLSDVNLDKMNLDIDMTLPDISKLSVSTALPIKPSVSKKSIADAVPDETITPDFTLKELTVGNLDDSTGMDTSLCSALANGTQQNMLRTLWDNNGVSSNSMSKSLSKADTISGLNALVNNDESYAYLRDVFNYVYEEPEVKVMSNVKRPKELIVVDNEESLFMDDSGDEDEEREKVDIVEKTKPVQKSKLKRDMTDYDMIYYKKLLNSSINYLSNYTNNEEVY